MAVQPIDATAIEAEVNQVRTLGIDALRRRWRMTFGASPPSGLIKDIIARMTLNVLLSFAQFEREVIGERVRDKIAASKAKGIWVGVRCRSATGASTRSWWSYPRKPKPSV